MVTVPVRELVGLGLALAVIVSVAEPEPALGLTLKNDALLLAVHDEGLQPLGAAVRMTGPDPPLPGRVPAVADRLNVHNEGP